jgi:hypothetical protein
MQNSGFELDQLKKDKSIATGLVTSLQKDMTNKVIKVVYLCLFQSILIFIKRIDIYF